MKHLPVIALALIAGVTIQTGGVCVVRAAHEASRGRFSQTVSNLVAACSAAAALLLARFMGQADAVPFFLPGLSAVGGGLIFAAGARLNGACAIGTIGRLAEGDLAYLATLAGAGVVAEYYAGPSPAVGGAALALGVQGAWLSAMIAMTAMAALLVRRREALIAWPSYLIVGFAGALLAASQSHWAWIDIVRDLARGVMLSPMGVIAGGAVLVGAVAAAAWRHRFRLRWPSWRQVLRDFAGGGLMMGGGLMIPGGNDGLILYGVPGGSPRAMAAWICMFLGLLGSFIFMHWWGRQGGAVPKNRVTRTSPIE